jgi:hopene-associated glycosyltransferase HpnB
VFFFQMLYPFPWVNDSRKKAAAAAGGCILLSRAALTRIGGLVAIRSDLIDDCALAHAVKRGGAIWLGLTHESRSLRAYDSLWEIWRMVTRTAFHQLRYSAVLLAITVVAMLLIYAVPLVVALSWPWHGNGAALLWATLALFMMALAYRPTLRLYGGGPAALMLLPVAATLYAAMTVDSARRHWLGRGAAWKARHYNALG